MEKLHVLGTSIFLVASIGFSTSQAAVKSENILTAKSNTIELAQSNSRFRPDPDYPNVLRDYGWTTRLPKTGKVTIRGNIKQLNSNRLFTRCPANTVVVAFAESTNYLTQICSKEYDLSLPKYYFGRDKKSGSSLKIVNNDADEANQLIFHNRGYTYLIYADGSRPEGSNAYLEVTQPNGKTYAEALLYLYDRR